MIKPYFEAVRIAMDEDTHEEFEYKTVLLWCSVMRLEEPSGDTFKNEAPKCVIKTDEGALWVLTPYEEVRAEWLRWLDAASNIQSVFTNN
ncbi:MAG: hypothetical protein EOO60_13105 [Hymenobacter sp.]|nr:MAG: hypothetical protein EOO60_13105 [Hymenobacter sp.]